MIPVTAKIKHPRAAALAVAREMCAALEPAAEKLIVAGSLRRLRPLVGDVEIVYIPKTHTAPNPTDFFSTIVGNEADEVIDQLRRRGVLTQRLAVTGRISSWGAENKHARHVASGIGVDLFATSAASWFNYLVCRTGPAESNERICRLAQERGWKWKPIGRGFVRLDENKNETEDWHVVACEADVFEFVGLPVRAPKDR